LRGRVKGLYGPEDLLNKNVNNHQKHTGTENYIFNVNL
jgi:hypothetical protein